MADNIVRLGALRRVSVLWLAAVLPATTLIAQTSRVAATAPVVAPDRRLVTIDVDRMLLTSVLDTIARQAKLVPAYDETVIPLERRVTVHVKSVPVHEAFQEALRGTGFVAQIQTSGDVFIIRDPSRADTGGVTGVVRDAATKKPLAGVTVTLDGTKFSVRTDGDGAYHIKGIPVGKYAVVVRRLGYAVSRYPVTVDENKAVSLDVTLAASATALQDVVTTVTGAQRRVELGNSIGVIKADSLMGEAPITSLSQLLMSRVPGLTVSQGQGTVGGNVKLQIRGLSSFSLSSEPIVIVDGIRYSSRVGADDFTPDNGREPVSPLNDLNPNDIETVEVVKGPSAATLYGTDASNGVIVITTKRGKAGPPRWSAFATRMRDEIPRTDAQKKLENVYTGWGKWQDLDGLYTIEGVNCGLQAVAERRCVQDSVTHTPGLLANDAFTMLKPSGSWTSGVNVSGGQQSLRYYFSGDYNDQIGAIGLPDTVLKIVRFQRGNAKLPESLLRPNTQTLLNLRSNVTASAGSKTDLTLSAGYTKGETRSVDPVFQPFTVAVGSSWCPQCVINRSLSFFSRASTETNDRYVSSLNGRAEVTSWLVARGTIGLDGATRNRHEVLPRDSTRELDPDGSIYEGRTHQVATSGDAGVTGTSDRGPVRFRTSVGGQYVRTLNDVVTATGTGLAAGSESLVFTQNRFSDQQYSETVTLGTYVEEMVGFNDRLFLSAAARADGSSGSGVGYKAAVYPKFSASWLLSQEPLFPHIPALDELRLRIALGESGRQALPTMRLPWLSLDNFPAGAGGAQYLDISSIGNPDLRPERGREVETGVDLGLFDQRAQLGLTWYNRRTRDQIVYQALAPGYGWNNRNVGLTTEHGFEAQITARLLETRLVSLSISAQHAFKTTKLVKLGGAAPVKDVNGGYVEGYPLGARFMRPLKGFNDVNGDSILVESEMQFADTAEYVGPTDPPRTQRLNINLGLFQQRLRLSALFDREAGATILGNYATCARCRSRYDRTVPLNEQAYGVFVLALSGTYAPPLSGTFTRFREASAAFTLPDRITRTLRVQSSSLALTARNLALWTKYTGTDPESTPIVGSLSPTYRAPQSGIPQSRTWTLRCDLTL